MYFKDNSPMSIDRRAFLKKAGMGFGGLALSTLMQEKAFAASQIYHGPHHTAKAKNVIFLYMDGGVSQVDSFDPKSMLKKHDGEDPSKFFKVEPTQFNNNGTILGSPWGFKKYGKSGLDISDLFPNIAKHADDLCIFRSMTSKFPEHTFANYFLHTGSGLQGRPSMGAWANYGLGSESENLPGYYMKNPHKAAMIQSLDESVGRVIRQLRKSGQLENTLIIFTGDNGSQGNEFVPDFRGNKGTAYEGGTRVPLIISGPNVKKGITDQATIAMDLYPTILDFIKAPLKPEEHQDGISITPILQGKALKKRLFYWHYPHYDETTPYSSAILGDWKIVHYADDGKVELYNLKDDPLEQNNLVARFPEKTAELSRRLESKLQSVNAQKALKNPNFNPNSFSGGIREYWRLEELKKKK